MCTYLKYVHLKSGRRSRTLSQIVINNAECRCSTRNNMLPIFLSAEISQSSIFNASHSDWFRNWFNFIIASIRTNDPNQFRNFLIRFMIATYRFYAPPNSHRFWLWSIIHISHKTMFFLSFSFSRFLDFLILIWLWLYDPIEMHFSKLMPLQPAAICTDQPARFRRLASWFVLDTVSN